MRKTASHLFPLLCTAFLLACSGGGSSSTSTSTGTDTGTTTGPGTTTGSTSGTDTTGSTSAASSTGPGAVCGNGVVEGDEVCDDGNQDPLDGCEPDCTPSSGKAIWTATYDREGKTDEVLAAARLPDGRFLALGWTQADTGYDTLLWFLNPDGTEDTAVAEDVGGDIVAPGTDERAYGLWVHDDGSFVISGHVEIDAGTDDWDVFLRRYDENAMPTWTYTWSSSMGGGTDLARGLSIGPNGTYLLAGNVPGANGIDGLLLALDENGNEVFATLYDGDGALDDLFYSVAYDGTQIWVAGTTDYNAPLDESKWLVAGFDDTGALQWKDAFPGQPDKFQRARSIRTDESGNAYVTGVLGSPSAGDVDVWVVAYDPTGTRTWATLYDGPSALVDDGLALARRDDGVVFFTGSTVVLGEQQNILMGRTEADGTLTWTASYNGDLGLTDVGTAVVIADDGYPIFFGYTTVSGQAEDAWARKVHP